MVFEVDNETECGLKIRVRCKYIEALAILITLADDVEDELLSEDIEDDNLLFPYKFLMSILELNVDVRFPSFNNSNLSFNELSTEIEAS